MAGAAPMQHLGHYYFLLFLPTKTIGVEIKEGIYHDNEHETVGSRHTRK